MKKLTIAALLAGQMATAVPPAIAAPLEDHPSLTDQRRGAFIGARLRIPLDGARDERRLRAGLTLAPTVRTRNADGAGRLRFGEGLELGVAGREPVRLSLAGRPIDRMAGPDGERLGVSTLGWIAIGVGASVVILVSALALCMDDSECNPSE